RLLSPCLLVGAHRCVGELSWVGCHRSRWQLGRVLLLLPQEGGRCGSAIELGIPPPQWQKIKEATYTISAICFASTQPQFGNRRIQEKLSCVPNLQSRRAWATMKASDFWIQWEGHMIRASVPPHTLTR